MSGAVVLAIHTPYEEMKARIAALTRSLHALRVLDALFDRPLFQAAEFSLRTGIVRQTLQPLPGKLKAEGILRQVHPAGGNRAETLRFPALLRLVEARGGD